MMIRYKKLIKILAGLFLFMIVINACQKEEIITDRNAGLQFSTDTVYFDTILATIGSRTQRFKIYNPHKQNIEVQEIYLAGGSESFFRLNLDGEKGETFKNIEIPGKDSVYVFVEATIDPSGERNPVVIIDSIVCLTNGNIQDVKLFAYGQDVNILKNEVLETQTWTSAKPYLILNTALVDTGEVLTIEPGARIFLHNFSSLVVLGQIEAIGTLEEPIVFSGDRFDGVYEQAAGQWGTIYIHPLSTGNLMEHVIIRNANAGLQVGFPDLENTPSIELRNCMILNSASIGIYAFGADIKAYNTIVADCGMLTLGLFMGGNYSFYHCTINNISAYYPNIVKDDYKSRSLPSVFFSNNYDWMELDDDFWIVDVNYPKDMRLNFYNSIVYGARAQEIVYDSISEVSFNYKFDHCLLKNHEDSLDYEDETRFVSLLLNEYPAFINDSVTLGDYDFQLNPLSPAVDAGDINLITGVPQVQYDFNGIIRTNDGNPDLGAYELIK